MFEIEIRTGATSKAVEFFESNKEWFGEIISAEMTSNPQIGEYHLILTNEYGDEMHISGGCTAGYGGTGPIGTYEVLFTAGFDVTQEFIQSNSAFTLKKQESQ